MRTKVFLVFFILATCAMMAQNTPASASFVLGTPTDPCTGANTANGEGPYTLPTPSATLKTLYFAKTFSCTFTLPNSGNWWVSFYWVEGNVTGPGQRVFNMDLNGARALTDFDIFGSGGTDPTKQIVRSFGITGNTITVSFTTTVRYATLFQVTATQILKQYQDLFTVDCGAPAKPAPACPVNCNCTLIQGNCTAGAPNTTFTASHPVITVNRLYLTGAKKYMIRDYSVVGNQVTINGVVSGDIIDFEYMGQ